MYQTTLTREQVKRVIAHVEFASKDTSLPVLNAVQIVADGNTLTVTSTDRYVLAESTLTVDEWQGETASALILSSDITNWKNLAKVSPTFRLTLGETWTLDAHTSEAKGMTVAGEYPSVGNLFPDDRTLHPIRPTTLSVTNLDKLGKFTRAAGIPTNERRWKIGQASPKDNAPIIALIEGTRALVMPIINYSNPESSPENYRHA